MFLFMSLKNITLASLTHTVQENHLKTNTGLDCGVNSNTNARTQVQKSKKIESLEAAVLKTLQGSHVERLEFSETSSGDENCGISVTHTSTEESCGCKCVCS
jgi:hypothetical protein